MPKNEIPREWDLGADRRYKRQNMERAMRGDIERGLVELITNSDDRYRDLEDDKIQTSGSIQIEIKRRNKQPSTVKVRDKACGMNRHEMYEKLGSLGGRTSGFEKGKARRGLNGRGAKDVAAFGAVHFESIKDGEYNHLIIPPSLKCHFEKPRPRKANREIRKKLGIPRDNGTVVTIDVENRFQIPRHEKLVENFSRYYSLRDIFSNPKRQVTIFDINKGREDPLPYKFPFGEVVFSDEIPIPNYPSAAAHFVIRQHASSFTPETLPYQEGGILVKSKAAIHDCTYFGLESDLLAWRFAGELSCEFIDKLILEYDDREEANPDNPNYPKNNPTRLLDPFRDGLMREHPFTQELYRKCKGILQPFIEKLKAAEQPPKRNVTDKTLDKKLSELSKEISKVFEKKIKELEEETPPEIISKRQIEKLPIGLHIIPTEEQSIVVNNPKTFSIIVKHYEALDISLPVNIISGDPENVKVRTSPVFLEISSEDNKVGRTTFTVESSKLGTEAYIEVRYDGYDKSLLVKVTEAPPTPDVPDGLSFEKPLYHLRINKEKTLTLWLKPRGKIDHQVVAQIISDHPTEISVKSGENCELHKDDRSGVLFGKCSIIGRQLKAEGEITARVKGFEPAKSHVIVEEHPPVSKFKFEPSEENFVSLRYKWENPYLLKIGAKHPSIGKYLGSLTENGYSGINTQPYHVVLAEVIAEALAFSILEKLFKKGGQGGMLDYTSTDAYYHKHFSDFLNIAHEILVTESVGI